MEEEKLKNYVVLKLLNNKLTLAHCSWVHKDGEVFKVKLPPNISSEFALHNLVFEDTKPNKSWKLYDVASVVGHSSRPGKIKKCLTQAKYDSDINSEFEFTSKKFKNSESRIIIRDLNDTDNNASLRDDVDEDAVLNAALKDYDNTNALSMIPYLRDVQENQKKIMDKLQYLEHLIENIMQNPSTSSSSSLNYYNEIKNSLPLTEQTIDIFDTKLSRDNDFKNEFISYVAGLAVPGDGRVQIRKIFNHVLDPTISRFYNWNGQKNKKALKGFKSIEIILSTVHVNSRKDIKLEEIIFSAREWLRSKSCNMKSQLAPVP